MGGISLRLKRIICLLALLCLLATALPLPRDMAQASAKYYITVDVTNQIVTVYDNGNTSDSGIVRQMICSTGKAATPTPLGTFSLPTKTYNTERTEWYYFSEYNCYAKWATRIYKGILFHSVLYSASKKGPTSSSTKALGSRASHGCVRLKVDDAKWIAQNCPAGTKVKVFNGSANADLAKRVKAKTFSRSSETYDHFMGRPEGSGSTAVVKINLSKGKKGAQVTELQNRLRGLGYYTGKVDAKFGSSTKTAVKNFQAAVGLKKTGKVNTDLWNRIFDAAAPTSTIATLAEGWQGPAVGVLQQALMDLKLYGGAVDGVFGAATAEAVRAYQTDFNQPVTGQADTALQNEAIQRARDVKAQFGAAEYLLTTTSTPVSMATITAKRYTRLRAKASSKGKKLAKLYKNAQVRVLSDDGGKWTQVRYNNTVGFVERKYLSFFTGTEILASYVPAPTPTPIPEPVVLAAPLEEGDGLTVELTAPEPTPEPIVTPEPTPVPTAEPTPVPTAEPTPVVTPEPTAEPTPEATQPPKYAVTLLDGATLYAGADAQGEALAQLPANAALEVVAAEGEWIAVLYEGQTAWIAAAEVELTDELPEIEEEAPTLEPGTEAEAEPAEEAADDEGSGLTLETEETPTPAEEAAAEETADPALEPAA